MTPNGAPIDPAEMRKWAAGVDKSLKDLQARLLPQRNDCDELSAELGAIYTTIDQARGDLDAAKSKMLEARAKKPDVKDDLDTREAQLFLAINAELGEDGKPLYGNEPARKKALTIALNTDKEHKELRQKLREIERAEVSYKALSESFDNARSDKRSQARALQSRLNNLTAQMN